MATDTTSSRSTSAIAAFLSEPAVPNPPPPRQRDYLLAAAVILVAIGEGIFRTDIAWPAISIPIVVLVFLSTPWRRSKPLWVLLAAIGTVISLDTAVWFAERPELVVYGMGFVLLMMLYVLGRWASGQHVAIGTLAAVGLWLFNVIIRYTNNGDLVGSLIVLMIPILIGLAIRFQSDARYQLVERAKVQERETLARELHDTVAHRVSAIAIQAQAGQMLARSGKVDDLPNTLATIEEEASRTLAEMRLMVGTLRDDATDLAMAPQHGLDDVHSLADASIRPGLDISVDFTGDLDNVDALTGGAIYRIAQESLTNAARHATGATKVEISVAGQPDIFTITITDNGKPTLNQASQPGFGLMGMAERAERLDGSFSAKAIAGGWRVEATLPRRNSHAVRVAAAPTKVVLP